jgi:xanthine dehydrogenase small subunit
MAPDEVLAFVRVPNPQPLEMLRAFKISKRFEDDISAVCLAIQLQVENGWVTQVSIGAGGVAATPERAVLTENALCGQAWTQTTVNSAVTTLRGEFQPISDMRASATYRTEVLGNLLKRFWLESQGQINPSLASTSLETFDLEGDPA